MTKRSVNPDGLAWPDCMFEEGFITHLSHEEGMKLLRVALESAFQNLQNIKLNEQTSFEPKKSRSGS